MIRNPAPSILVHSATPNGCAPPDMAILAREKEYPQATPMNNKTNQAHNRPKKRAGEAASLLSTFVDAGGLSKKRSFVSWMNRWSSTKSKFSRNLVNVCFWLFQDLKPKCLANIADGSDAPLRQVANLIV